MKSIMCLTFSLRRASPEGRSVSATPISPTFLTITFAKSKGLGVIIAGGVNRPNGPHIFVEKVLEGMDAAKVWDCVLRPEDWLARVSNYSCTTMVGL